MAEPSSKKRKTDGPTITDSRFANIQSDPRYRLPGKRQKVKLDNRFSRVLQDEDFGRKAKVDRYGRPLETDSERKRLKRKYEFEEDESEEADDGKEVQAALRGPEKTHDPLREGRDAASSSEESSSEEEDDEEVEFEEGPGFAGEQGDIPVGEVSSRLAVVNLDWDNIRAEDLFAVFASFLPAAGRLLQVSIYPSEFGKERLDREEMEGPPREIFAASQGKGEDEDDDEEDMKSDLDVEERTEDDVKASLMRPDDGSEFDSAALRRYQLERLRYYYAILTFSSPSVAKTIYDACDGTEYLTTANFFDLRFVPDDTEFSDDMPKDQCDKISDGYKPNEFVTDALQHSTVRLTWDAEDGGRKEAAARAFKGGRKEIDENDLKAYLGTDSEDDDEDEINAIEDEHEAEKPMSKKDAERQKMRALLGLAPEPVKRSRKEKDGPVGEVQITFSSGLSGADPDSRSKRSIFENSPEPDETTVEKYVRKERERKQKRKEKMKAGREGESVPDANNKLNNGEAEPDTAPEAETDLGFDDPFFAEPSNDTASTNKIRKEERLKKRAEREADEAATAHQRAELELLMADDNTTKGEKGTAVRHFDMNEIEKAEKQARKGRKGKHAAKPHTIADDAVTNPVDDDFKVNAADPRFARLFESHEYAIDPTNPRFKGTKGMKDLLEEGRRRKKNQTTDRNGADRHEDERMKASKKENRVGRGSTAGRPAGGANGEVKRLAEKIKKRGNA